MSTHDPWRSRAYVDRYNEVFRFDPADAIAYLARFDLGPDDELVDFGCGEGAVVAVACRTVRRALAIDVSEHQLARARTLLEGVTNATLQQRSFLECDLAGWRFTRGSARKSLHHLADPDKVRFFARIAPSFAKGALFVIEDAVLDFPRSELTARWDALMDEARGFYGPRWASMSTDFQAMMSDEFPTGIDAWREGLCAGGFQILERERRSCFYSVLVARKETE